MFSSPFDIFGLIDRLKETVNPYLPEYAPVLGGLAFLAVALKMTIRLLTGKKTSGGGVNLQVSANANGSESSQSGGGSVSGDAEKQKEQQNEQERAQDQLKELFELFDSGKEKPQELQKNQEDKELESLGLERQDLEKLKEQYKELVAEIAALLEKGLTADQTARSLISRTTEQIPLMELQPLIEAMTCFLKKNEEAEKNTAVIGMDPLFEQKAALSALKRGEYETALDFLERKGNEAENKIKGSHRSDVRMEASKQAALFYRAVAVLSRPLDAQKSFDALKKSQQCDRDNPLTTALLGRAYHESGKSKTAQNMFEEISADKNKNDYVVQYADQMLSEIRTQRTFLQAQRIRQEYEKRLEDVEPRQKISQNAPLALQKHNDVKRANARFAAAEWRDRENEREVV